jgi:hypothetical protein
MMVFLASNSGANSARGSDSVCALKFPNIAFEADAVGQYIASCRVRTPRVSTRR